MLKINVRLTTLGFICFISLFSCTSGPIDSGKTVSGIRGRITITENLNPAGIYVWIEKLDVATRTNSNGEFLLSLPPSFSQGGADGVSGFFTVYFFAVNYQLETAQAFIQNGQFNFLKGDFDQNGELKKSILLKQNLSIITEVVSEVASPSIFDSINVNVFLQAANTQVSVTLPITQPDEGKIGGIFLKNTTSGKIYTLRTLFQNLQGEYVPIERNDTFIVYSNPTKRSTNFIATEKSIPAGNYEVIPYILLRNSNVPEELTKSLGDSIESFTPAYLTIPFLRKNGTLNLSQTAVF